MAGTIIADVIQSDQSYPSSINITSPVIVSNNVGIGTTNTPSNKDTVTPKLVVNGAGVAGSMQVVRNTTVGAGGAILELTATRGSDVNSYTILQSGDGIGTVVFGGADGNEFVVAGSIQCQVDGTPGDNDMPGRLIFNTTSDGASGPTERMRIDSSGNVGIGTSSPQSLLDLTGNDPTLRFTDNGGSPTATFSIRSADASFRVRDVTNSLDRLSIDTSGNFQFNSGYGSVATAYGCRAWVNFNGIGTVAIRASGNVSSITDNNVGSYTVNFTTTLADANYSVSGIPRNTQTYAAIQVLAIGISQATAPTTSALAIVVTGQNDGAVRSAVDSDYVCLAIFR